MANNVQNVLPPIAILNRGEMPRGKATDTKPKGRMSAYAFFVHTFHEEHKKEHPDENFNFAEFSKKCSDRWKTMNDKEKEKFHKMADNMSMTHGQ